MRNDRLPLLIGASFVGVALAAMLLVDLALGWTVAARPLWYLLFREGGPSEHLSWLLLGAAALLGAASAGRSSGADARFWAWFAFGAILLLIEDAGNTSHRFARDLDVFAGQVFGFEVSRDGGRLVVFAILGAVMLGVLLRFRDQWSRWPSVRRMLLAGYVLYGVAAGASVPFNLLGAGYQSVGDTLLATLFGGQLSRLPEPIWGATSDNTGYVFMDLVVEESIEVLAAALLATAAWRGWLQLTAATSAVQQRE